MLWLGKTYKVNNYKCVSSLHLQAMKTVTCDVQETWNIHSPIINKRTYRLGGQGGGRDLGVVVGREKNMIKNTLFEVS